MPRLKIKYRQGFQVPPVHNHTCLYLFVQNFMKIARMRGQNFRPVWLDGDLAHDYFDSCTRLVNEGMGI